MARSVSFSTTLAEVTPYWEPALWVLIVVVTVGIVGSALWAPSRTGHRRGRRRFFHRSDARARREERDAVAATMVPAANGAARPSATSDVAAAETVPSVAAPVLFDQADVASEPVASEPVASEPVASEPAVSDRLVAEPVAAEPVAAEPVAAEPASEYPPPAPVPIANGVSMAERPLGPGAGPDRDVATVAFADCEGGFVRLASDVATLTEQVAFFDERSTVPPEMPTWPIEHQQALAERAAEALADPLDELLEYSLTVASDVRALDRILGGRPHDEEAAQAIVGTRIDLDGLRRHLGRIHHRFLTLAHDLGDLAGTAEQLAKVVSIVDATDAVMGSWEPMMAEAEQVASGRR